MAAPAKPISNIAIAFAAAAEKDAATTGDGAPPVPQASVPPPGPGVGSLAALGVLPTPPNSISPTLPPHKVRASLRHRGSVLPPILVDSDVDLHDAEDSPRGADVSGGSVNPQPLSSAALSALSASDPTGAITPQMLAAHHLPDILLANGPIAIRYVLAHLTQGVPGFARIPPAKARRLVVAALESRAGGGEHGEIVFEKVGWGRWDARKRGEGGRTASGGLGIPRADALSPPVSMPGSYALSSAGDAQIPHPSRYGRRRQRARRWSASNGDGSASTSGGLDLLWADQQADDMSLDGSDDSPDYAYGENEPRIKHLPIDEGDTDDATDEEDWAGMGADALRQASASAPRAAGVPYYPRGPGSSIRHRPSLQPRMTSSSGGGPGMAKSVPMPVPARPQQWRENRHVASSAGSRAASRRGSSMSFHPYAASLDHHRSSVRGSSVLQHGGVAKGMEMIVDTEGAATGDPEREAIEALLKMGAM